MANTVTDLINTIDITFPVAGQDNDSQGFRNNFNIIRSSLLATEGQINDIENMSNVQYIKKDLDNEITIYYNINEINYKSKNIDGSSNETYIEIDNEDIDVNEYLIDLKLEYKDLKTKAIYDICRNKYIFIIY